MITINNYGKFVVPKDECFIGYTGDNLNVTKEIFVEGITDLSLVYRMYLKFDDGTCNYFLLESEVQQDGTMLVWTITNDQIYKGGVVQVQIKASNSSGEVFHSSITTMLVQTSVEFTDYFRKKDNSEFLQHEEYLNNILQLQKQAGDVATDAVNAANQAVETSNSVLSMAKDTLDTAISATDKVNQANQTVTDTLAKVESKLQEYYDMEMDDTPTADSTAPVTSGGVYNALSTKVNYKTMGHIASLSNFDTLTDRNTIYDMTVSNTLLDGTNGFTTAKLINYSDKQSLLLSDGRIFSRDTVNNTNFVQTGYTKEEIINSFFETGTGTLEVSNSMALLGRYSYSKVGNVVTLIFTATVQTPLNNEENARFTNLPYLPSNGKSMTSVIFSNTMHLYQAYISNDTLIINPVSKDNFSSIPPTDHDVIVSELTYLV